MRSEIRDPVRSSKLDKASTPHRGSAVSGLVDADHQLGSGSEMSLVSYRRLIFCLLWGHGGTMRKVDSPWQKCRSVKTRKGRRELSSGSGRVVLSVPQLSFLDDVRSGKANLSLSLSYVVLWICGGGNRKAVAEKRLSL